MFRLTRSLIIRDEDVDTQGDAFRVSGRVLPSSTRSNISARPPWSCVYRGTVSKLLHRGVSDDDRVSTWAVKMYRNHRRASNLTRSVFLIDSIMTLVRLPCMHSTADSPRVRRSSVQPGYLGDQQLAEMFYIKKARLRRKKVSYRWKINASIIITKHLTFLRRRNKFVRVISRVSDFANCRKRDRVIRSYTYIDHFTLDITRFIKLD